MAQVLRYVEERHRIADRVSTPERADAWIVNAWAETMLGNLANAEQAAENSRAGFGSGQAASFVLGATCWRIVALHALGRWDEVMQEASRAERSLDESQLTAPWYAFNGFVAILATARARNDAVAKDHWKSLMLRLTDRVPPDDRIRRMLGYVTGDLDALAQGAIHEFRLFSPRLDYVHLASGLLADRRFAVSAEAVSAIVEYSEDRQLLLVSAQARRLRGLVLRSREDLDVALAGFEQMRAAPFVARARTEIGLLTDDAALVDRGMDELEALKDVEQAARVAAERRSGLAVGQPG
jgi:hypothetical protein